MQFPGQLAISSSFINAGVLRINFDRCELPLEIVLLEISVNLSVAGDRKNAIAITKARADRQKVETGLEGTWNVSR